MSMSLPRRWITDLMRHCRGVPLITMVRPMRLGELVRARSECDPKPAWPLIFLKAYAIVAARRPELRRVFMDGLRPRIYEHPESVATLAIERDFRGEPAIFFALFRTPDQQTLPELGGHLTDYLTTPVEEFGHFRRIIRVSRYPTPIRRLLWWYGLQLSPRRRIRLIGTFGMSVTASLGAWATRVNSPSATTINYGAFDEDGKIDVFLTFDHRVIDGAPVARAMAELEAVLMTELFAEVSGLAMRDR